MKSQTGLYRPFSSRKWRKNPSSLALKAGIRWSSKPTTIAHERCHGRTSLNTEFSDSLLGRNLTKRQNRQQSAQRRIDGTWPPRFTPFTCSFFLWVTIWAASAPIYGQGEIRSLIESGRLLEAAQLVQQKLGENPSSPDWLYWKAAVALSEGDTGEAERTLQQVVRNQAASAPHFLLLGEIYDRRQQWKEAAGAYRRALAFPHGSDLLIRLSRSEFRAGNLPAVIETLRPLSESPEASGEVHFLLALSHGRRGDVELSVERLSKAVEQQPDIATYHFQYALALAESGKLKNAVKELRRTLELEPNQAMAHFYLGQMLHNMNRRDDALAALERAERLEPRIPQLAFSLGLLYKLQGDYDKAIMKLEAEIAAGTNHPPAHFHLAEILFRRNETRRSEELIKRAIALQPGMADYHLLATEIALSADRLEEAEKQVQAAIGSDPNSGQAHYLRGRVLQAMGRHQEAGSAFERSRRLMDGRREGSPAP